MMAISKVSAAGREFLAREEGGHYLKAYRCQAGVPTISVGVTFYEDGTKVKMGDTLTLERSEELFANHLSFYEKHVGVMCRDDINQNQFDALVSFCYNIGHVGLKNSTLLQKVNANPNDPSIASEFRKWVRVNASFDGVDNDGDGLVDEAGEKKVSKGLKSRREREITLYFS